MIAGPGFWDQEIERAGWSRALSAGPADFPEITGRSRVWGRNCYVRGRDRLVIEWSDQVTIAAALLNGRPCPLGSPEDLSKAIAQDHRPGW
ncbi:MULTISPECIES: hypothetical protein [Kitasatospora]|uniref:Uncharacterized protein n=1 Tax=Kitasatospora arboriphila TaxID=258052 RepID=A0ABN1TB87_9ACTN